jgi:hypothetical protein
VSGRQGRGRPGIDFTKLHFGPKTFRINFRPQILDKFAHNTTDKILLGNSDKSLIF